MKKSNFILLFILCLSLVLPGIAKQTKDTTVIKPRPLEDVADILAWKSIRTSVISDNGAWLAYIIGPQEGNLEVVFRQIKGEKEYRFPIGETPRYVSSSVMTFSCDSRKAAFTRYPDREDARKLKKQKKKLYNNVILVDLASGEKTEFKKIKNFSFSSENPAWLAMHRYPAESQAKEKDKWAGSDLLLVGLKKEETLNIGNVSEFAFNKKGQWLAIAIDAQGKSGNGIQLHNLQSGVITPLDHAEAVYKQLTWTEKGDGLTVLKGKEDDDFENKRFAVLGFSDLSAAGQAKVFYNPGQDKNFPKKMTISPNRAPVWTDDFSAILFGIHELKEKEDKKPKPEEAEKEEKPKLEKPAKIDEEDLPGLVIWHWKDKRMQSQQQVQESRDKNFSFLSIYHIKDKKFMRLADETLRNISPTPKFRWGIGRDSRKYELDGNLYGRRFSDIYRVDLKTGARELVLEKCRWYFFPSPEGTDFLYFQDGHYFTYDLAAQKSFNVTKDIPTSFVDTEDDHNVIDPPIRPYGWGWTKGGKSLLLYDDWDIWLIPVQGGKGVNLTVSGKTDGIRFRSRFVFDPEEKGIDLTKPLYISTYGEWTKKSGIARIDKGIPKPKMLLWDDALFSVHKAKKAETYLYTRQTYKDYPDYYVSDAALKPGIKITDTNPQQSKFLWSSGSRLIEYQSTKGDRLQAALFLPADYKEGQSYPTLVYIYEKNSQHLNRYYAPAARGFNKSVYTSRGYAVLMPDIVYQINEPGMSSVWCVLPAIEAAAATGIVDKNRVGLHGHSWGGYQTAFLITQTELFKAAVAGAPLTNMISMYSLIYWNSGSANQPIFESSQGRFKGNYLDNIEAYTRNSPVYFAHRVKTPLIILHNDKDGAVDWTQGIEYFNTLRQLKKPVVMLQYKGENHGLRKPPNMKDYYIRMREFFDHHLLDKPAPKWLQEGVAHLAHKDHIEQRTQQILPKKEQQKVKKKEEKK